MEPVKISTENALAFRKPWKSCISAALWGIFFAVSLPGVMVLGYAGSAHSTPMNPGSWILFGIMEWISLAFAGLFLYNSGPEHLDLDLSRRIYRYVFGWPFMPQVQEGPWEDIGGVYLWDMNSSRLSGYGVGIAWKGNRMRSRLLGTRSTLLGTFDGLGRLDRANRLAEDIASLLDVPLVEPPFPVQSPRTWS